MKQVRYTEQQREWAVTQMMPPLNKPITELAKTTGITEVTLRTWQNAARAKGKVVPGDGKQADQWSGTDKFLMVLEAAPLNAAELSAYCRRKGVYPEQIAQWRVACEQANTASVGAGKRKAIAAVKPDAVHLKRIAQLEKSVQKKDRQLVEAKAIEAMLKKAKAIWGKDEDK